MRRWVLILFLAITLIGCDGEEKRAFKQLGKADGCDAATVECEVRAAGLTVSLALGPNIKPLAPFSVKVNIEGGKGAVKSVVADFQMQGMDMGRNRYRLQKAKSSDWQGTATLPVCTASRMDWMALIEFTHNGESYQAVFPFHTETN